MKFRLQLYVEAIYVNFIKISFGDPPALALLLNIFLSSLT